MASISLGAGLADHSLNFVIQNWQVDDGLPANGVNAIVQTQDGYIWIATFSGLARFDGQKFTVYNDNNSPELPSSQISSLYEDKSGTLWIGYETGQLTRYKDGHFETVPIEPKWKRPPIWQIGTDEGGDIWLVNEHELLYRLKDELELTPPSGTAPGFYSFQKNADGRMWISRNGLLSTLEKGHLQTLLFDENAFSNSYVQGVCKSRSGGLWVVNESHLRRWDDNKWVDDLGLCPAGFAQVTAMIETQSGLLAVGTPDHGLYLIQPHGETLCLNHTNGLSSDWVRSLCEDREGNLWVGTGAAGLFMLRLGNFLTLNPPDKWLGRSVLSVAADSSGGIWVGSDGSGLYHYFQGQWTNWGVYDGLSNPYVWSVSADLSGKVLLGIWNGGLSIKDGNSFVTPPSWQDTLTSVTALLRRSDGSYWVGTDNGLILYQSGKFIPLSQNGTNPFPNVRAILEEKDGALWVGMNGHGLGRLQNGQISIFRKNDGLASDFVNCLQLGDDGSLWIGTYGGLSRFANGHIATITTENGLPNNTICDIEDDGHGYYWLSSHGGIVRVKKSEMSRCADGLVQSLNCFCFGKSDGLPTQECSGGFQPAGCMTTNGWLYFPTSKGLVAVEPGAIKTNPLPPPVAIESLLVDGKVVDGDLPANSLLKISAGRHQVEFRYTALSFVAPDKDQFKYRLDGLDSKWVNAGVKRDVIYSYIPPGQYSFHVTACNNDGVWNEAGDSIAFTVLPYFWQTAWFRTTGLAGIMLATGGGVWYGTRRRMRRKLELLEQQRTIERERTRIAKDIHDDLGASLTRINLLSQSARRGMDDLPQTLKNLDQICTTAWQLTRAMDEIVWAVDPQHDTLDSLAAYMEKLIRELLADSGIRCRLDFPVNLPAWSITAEVRHNLCMAFKEALHNILKHSGATEVYISFILEPTMTVSVTDNGRGFDPAAISNPLPQSRHGLGNMRKRLQEIGGHCEIKSECGRGTRITFILTPEKVMQ
jgi:ligand-binding sensor domain-containing protein/signal transduction histidine kinase